jgi:DNA polymerase-3 subunit gamma/tau
VADIKSESPAGLPRNSQKPLSADLGARFLLSICAAEQLSSELAGIALLQAAVGGHPRALFALEKVAEFGAITEANVRVALNLDIVDRLMAYGDELLSGDFGKQIDLIEGWIEAPLRKLEFLHCFLVFNYFASLRHLRRDDPIMRGLTEEFQQKFLQGMVTRAGRLKLDEEVFWQNAIAALVPKEHISHHELLMVLARFDRLINPTPISWANPGKHAIAQPAIKKLRVVKDAAAPDNSAGDYLAWEEFRPVWQAGTFLAQHYGSLLNLRMTIRHGAMGIHGHAAGSGLASDLTHELGMRLQDWGASVDRQFHWMLRHEADHDGDLVTRVMMSVPIDHLPAAIHWARNRFLRRRAGKEASSALFIACRDGGLPEE